MEEDIEDIMSYLQSNNAMYPADIDEYGETIYKFNMHILKEIMPSLYDAIMEDLDKDLMELYKKGLVDIEYDEELNASFSISEKGKQYLRTGTVPGDED